MAVKSPASMDEYIAGFSGEVKKRLVRMRALIARHAPRAEEAMAYGIPTFRLNGNLVHFAGYKGHIGFYPAPSGIEAFKARLSGFEFARGSVRFPLSKPLPEDLVADIVKFRVRENGNPGTAGKRRRRARRRTNRKVTRRPRPSSHAFTARR